MLEIDPPRIVSSETTLTGDTLVTSNSSASSLAAAVANHLSQVSPFLFRLEFDGPIGQAPRYVVKKIILDPVNPLTELSRMTAVTFTTEGDRIRISILFCDAETKVLLDRYLSGLTQSN